MKIPIKTQLKFGDFDQYAKLVMQADLLLTVRNEIEEPIQDRS